MAEPVKNESCPVCDENLPKKKELAIDTFFSFLELTINYVKY